MGPGLLALIVFIALIIIWAVVLKRNIVEAALISMIILPFFGGVEAGPGLLVGSLEYVLNYEVLYASLAFIVMSFLLQHSHVLDGMLHIFTRLFGRLKGGPAYVNTGLSSVLGCMSGGNTPNAATSGAFTAEWLLRSGWTREQAATLIAANGGLGAGFPPCAGLFIVLGFPTVAGFVSEGQLYIALFVTGLYQVVWRIIYIQYVVHKNHLQPTSSGSTETIGEVLRKYGINLTLFLGAIIPVALTMGPLFDALVARSEAWESAMDSVNLLVWLPTLMICIILILDGKNIVKQFSGWEDFVKKFIPHIANTGGLLFFIFAASNTIHQAGPGRRRSGRAGPDESVPHHYPDRGLCPGGRGGRSSVLHRHPDRSRRGRPCHPGGRGLRPPDHRCGSADDLLHRGRLSPRFRRAVRGLRPHRVRPAQDLPAPHRLVCGPHRGDGLPGGRWDSAGTVTDRRQTVCRNCFIF